ncbi:MBL fold metallo-hydrolase [bacterium]|nr:MBL fold metallo-hydrolase [bacterium]
MKTEKNSGKLSLTNNGELELFFIGTGSAFAKNLYQTNFLIIKGDTHILVDFGITGPAALREIAGLDVTDIEVVLPTHSHSDHTGGIEGLALMNRYVGRRFMNKPLMKMIVTEDYQKLLWEESLKGGLACNELSDDPSGLLTCSDFFESVHPALKKNCSRQVFEINYNGIQLELFRTFHIPEGADSWVTSLPSYGLFIDNRIFFSGDTQFDQDLIDMYANKSEIMIQDIQFFTGGVHVSLEELQGLPSAIKKKMMLVHYNDAWSEKDISEFGGWCHQGIKYIFP